MLYLSSHGNLEQGPTRGEFPGGTRRWVLATLEALTPPLLQRARLRAQQITARREEEEEAEAERSRRGRGRRVGTRSEASVAVGTRDKRLATSSNAIQTLDY